MAEINQADYMTWKTSTFGDLYYIWHDGLPIEAVTSLSGDARSHAVRMLMFGVQNKDGHAATALAAMGESSALPDLRTALSTASGEDKVSIAGAINQLSREEDSSHMAKELVSVLEAQALHWGTKINAAMGLRAFKDKESEEALLRAVEEQDQYLVKYHSCGSLLVRWGVEPSDISRHPAIFSLIRDVREEDTIKDEAERGREAVRLLNQLKNEGGRAV
jgi:HEAT repeat protein